jgi:signal transduction histidine kinase/CheY-like chemotaxis protein
MKQLLPKLASKEMVRFVAVFVLIFLSAKIGQYFFFSWKTSPAVLWPPTGIALAIIWIGGYRYAIPIFLALVTASILGPVSNLIPAIVTTPFGQVLGYVIGVALLKRFKFDGSFGKMRNVLLVLIVIFFTCMVAPTISTSISWATGHLTASAFLSWSRAWGGYVFSCLVFFPLIVTWKTPPSGLARPKYVESFLAALLLSASVYFLFWTRIAADYSFIFFAMFFIAHFWVAFRFSSRIVALSIFMTVIIGFSGLFLSPVPDKMLNSQLFNTELFLLIIFPIFYIFSALVKERAKSLEELRGALGSIAGESDNKTAFIAVLAHELRNPLAPVKSTLELLGLQKNSPDIQKLIEGAQGQVHSMKRLLDDLLDVNRIKQGKLYLEVERTNLCSLIEKSVEATKDLYAERRHMLKTDPNCDTAIWLDVDPLRFQQVIINLLNNAAKYTNPGGRVEISHKITDGSLELMIRDNGLGIDKKNFTDIFEPFWQKSPSVTSSGGIGVGLSLTRHIVEMHGGSIWVESPGRGMGSTFTVRMPLPLQEKRNLPITSPKTQKAGRRFSILIADDNEVAAKALSKLLSHNGHKVMAAYDGKGTLDTLKKFKADILLLDIGLPDMSGYEIAEKVREEKFKGAIIALSGYGQEEDKQKALLSGCDHHFTKPVSIVSLEEYFSTIDPPPERPSGPLSDFLRAL